MISVIAYYIGSNPCECLYFASSLNKIHVPCKLSLIYTLKIYKCNGETVQESHTS